MQIRRVLLLFALVLGLSALVASIAPPPKEADDERTTGTAAAAPSSPSGPVEPTVRLPAKGVRRVRVGSAFSLEVPVREAGDVVLQGLGFRQTADPHSPARFYLLASPKGRYDVAFEPVLGGKRVIGQLAFVEPATVTQRRRDR